MSCTKKDTFIILPGTLTENAETLRRRILDDETLYKNIQEILPEELIQELDFFSDIELSIEYFGNLNEWYIDKGRLIIEKFIKSSILTDEYQFLSQLPSDVKVIEFNDYDQAFEFLVTYQPTVQNNKFKLWILDRELNGIDRNIDIINLLELLSSKDKSAIGIVYTGRNLDIKTREQIYTFVQKMIEENKPIIKDEELKDLFNKIAEESGKDLFVKNYNFREEIARNFDQLYTLKTDINNLFWVIPKGGFVQDDTFRDAINRAKYGFEIYRLLNTHSTQRLKSLSYALQQTTKLELSDIEYLKSRSIIEGLNISDTLIRLHDSYANNEFSHSLLKESSYFDSIRNLESWEINQPQSATNKFERILAQEKFDMNVNKYFRPIMTGDIFEIMHPTLNGRSKNIYGMLLTQECDCVIRENSNKIKRKVEYATMVTLVIKKNNIDIKNPLELMAIKLEQELQKHEIDKEGVAALLEEMRQASQQAAATNEDEGIEYKIPLSPFIYTNVDGSESPELLKIQLYLRQIFHIPFSTLDLCTLSSDGVAKFNTDNLNEIKEKIVSLYPSYYQTYLKKLVEKLEGSTGSASSFTRDTKIYERDLNMFQTLENNTINFRIRRIARLKMPHTNFVQAFYGLTQSNVGLPMDI